MRQLLKNFFRFFYDPAYQEEIYWVRWIISRVSFIHQHVWTILRLPGGLFTIWVDFRYGHWQSLAALSLFALTDWFDGKVKRYRERKGISGWIDEIILNKRFGSILDGTVDKLFIIPIIFYWGWGYCFSLLLCAMAMIEVLGNPYLAYLEKKGRIKRGRNIYEHLGVGKFKFCLQVSMAFILWLARIYPFESQEVVINFLLSIIIVLAFLSVFCKAKPDTCEKLWQSSGN